MAEELTDSEDKKGGDTTNKGPINKMEELKTAVENTKALFKIPPAQAAKEVNDWLNYKQVSDIKRDGLTGNIQTLIIALCEGRITIDPETFVITQTLRFPIDDIKELKYKPRIQMREIQSNMVGVSATDSYGSIFAHAAALTGQNSAIIKKLDSEDFIIADHLSFFFMA